MLNFDTSILVNILHNENKLQQTEDIMKKRLIILIGVLFALSCIGLTACGGSDEGTDLSDSPYVGEWVVSDLSMGDESEALSEDYTMTINGDGTGTLTAEGETSNFTWTPTDEGFKTAGDMKVKFTADSEDAIHAKIFGVSLNFVRAGSEATEETDETAEAEETSEEAAPSDYSSQLVQFDQATTQDVVFQSPKLENNFISVYFDNFMNTSN